MAFGQHSDAMTRSYITNCPSAAPSIWSNPNVKCVNGNIGVLGSHDNVENPKVQFGSTARIRKL
jgi:hypothetical protein